MSINKYKPHIVVLPEDDANRQMANGFIYHFKVIHNVIQILPVSGGWIKVVEQFGKNYAPKMREFPNRIMVLLIDFDEQENRLSDVKNQIPDDLKGRVFILGVQSEPENLRKETDMTFEKIGDSLAEECAEGKNELWQHQLLKHNEIELKQLTSSVKSFLFE